MLIFIRIQKKIHDLNCSLVSAALSDPVLSELFKLDLLNKSHFQCGQWRSVGVFTRGATHLMFPGVSSLKTKLASVLEQSQLNGVFYT